MFKLENLRENPSREKEEEIRFLRDWSAKSDRPLVRLLAILLRAINPGEW